MIHVVRDHGIWTDNTGRETVLRTRRNGRRVRTVRTLREALPLTGDNISEYGVGIPEHLHGA